MNDLRNRLDHLAADATDGIELRDPRHLPASRRSVRAWIAGLLASVLAAVAALAGGQVVLNTGGSTDVRTISTPAPTTEVPPTTAVPDSVVEPPAPPAPSDPTPGFVPDPTPAPTPPAPDPAPGAPGDGPGDDPGASAVVARYGTLGPETAVPPNDGSAGTAGSGCSPGSSGSLPDGVWMVDVVEFGSDRLTVDLLCYTTVESDLEGGLFEDYVLSNDSTRTRSVPLAADAGFFLQTVPPVQSVDDRSEIRAFGDPAAAARFAAESGDATPLGWLLVEGGRVVEFYSPPLASA